MATSELSIIIPTWHAGHRLKRLLSWCNSYCSGAEIIVSDAGSTDDTLAIAQEFNAQIVTGARGRGGQCARGVAASNRPWLLILHADSQLAADFSTAITNHMAKRPEQAGYGWLRFDTPDWRARFVAIGANIRSRAFGLPYGDQGLLLPRHLYDQAGGYPDWPLMEDVELVRRIKRQHGRQAVKPLLATIVTDPARYQRDGYCQRVWRNLSCLFAYYTGKPIDAIAARYQAKGDGHG